MQPNKEQNQASGPVMDIQRPSSQPAPSVQRPSAPTVITPNDRPATMEYTRPRPTANSETPNNKFAFSPKSDLSFESQNVPKKSKKGLVLAVFVVLFIGLAAGGGAFYYFSIYKNKSQPVAPAPQPVATDQSTIEAQAVEATPEGVDKTTEEIDKQLNTTDDTQDFSADDVSDASLGL